MPINLNQNILRWTIVVTSLIIVSLILWNTYVFFQNFKAEERAKMQTISFAQSDFLESINNLDKEVSNLTTEVLETNTSIPMMIVDPNNQIISIRNIDTLKTKTPKAYLERLKVQFENENNPIQIQYQNTIFGLIYYGNSELLNKLKYYPMALLLIIFLFGAVVYFFYRSSKNAAQNKLWTGMAKETAHQIGTPLSSLVGWTEILRSDNVNPDYLIEIEKDITRLKTITDRFSKIGSVPTLIRSNIIEETMEAFEYVKARASKLIDFEIKTPDTILYVDLNPQLFSWTIENLVKNAIDAMKGKGLLKLELTHDSKTVKINITDTGKGIPKQKYNKIFEPGFTSKKRGWGLGLSLAKRIVEDYHNGKVKVLHSEIGKGTTMQISLKLVS